MTSKPLTLENTGLEIANLSGDCKEEQGTCIYISSGEKSHDQIIVPFQSQSVSTTNLELESADNTGNDGLSNERRVKLGIKFTLNNTELKELQVANVATCAGRSTGMRMFGVGAGTFMY